MIKLNLAIMALLCLMLMACNENELSGSQHEEVKLSARNVQGIVLIFLAQNGTTISVSANEVELDYLSAEWVDILVQTSTGAVSYTGKDLHFSSNTSDEMRITDEDGDEYLSNDFLGDPCNDLLCLVDANSGQQFSDTSFIIEDTIEGI